MDRAGVGVAFAAVRAVGRCLVVVDLGVESLQPSVLNPLNPTKNAETCGTITANRHNRPRLTAFFFRRLIFSVLAVLHGICACAVA